MKCGMTEKKAKDILTLLAKKAGFDGITFSAFDDDIYLGCIKKSKHYFIGWISCSRFFGVTSQEVNYIKTFNEIKSSKKSYKHFLKMMLDVAKGYDIKTYGPENAVVVMRKGTTLEELLVDLDLLGAMANIEMDLKDGLK